MTAGTDESRSGNRSKADDDAENEHASTDPSPSDAFGALGNETRMAVVRALDDGEPLAFSALHEATDEDTSAGFAYHLRQLAGRFVRQRDDERYELTDAGRAVARAVRSGTYTESVDRDPLDLDEDCPLCGEGALVATVTDNVTEIACESCERPLLGMSFPPSGYADRDEQDLPDAFDAHHRRRIGAFADGVCPECAGPVEAVIEPAIERVDGVDVDELDAGDGHLPVRASFACDACGADLRCPVALTLLDHPAVVAFYHDHDRDVRDRPIWNVGTEWRERVVSRDPWCVRISVRLGDDDLLVYVGGDGAVVDHRRADVEEEPTVEEEPAIEEESSVGDSQVDSSRADSQQGEADGASA